MKGAQLKLKYIFLDFGETARDHVLHEDTVCTVIMGIETPAVHVWITIHCGLPGL